MPSPYYPHPRQFIRIRENETAYGPILYPGFGGYKVPPGKLFVPTAIGCTSFNTATGLVNSPCFFAAIFYPGMPDYPGNGNNGREFISGLSGPSSDDFIASGKFAANICTYVSIPIGLVYREGAELIVQGGSTFHTEDPVIDPPDTTDACLYGFVCDA